MLRDIASGMVFLHSRKPPIVHGDLRSPNLVSAQHDAAWWAVPSSALLLITSLACPPKAGLCNAAAMMPMCLRSGCVRVFAGKQKPAWLLRAPLMLQTAVTPCFCLQLLDLTIERDRPRFHVKIADFGLARMVGPTSSIAVSKVRPVHTALRPLHLARGCAALCCAAALSLVLVEPWWQKHSMLARQHPTELR